MRGRWVALAVVLVLLGGLAFMVFSPAVEADVEAQAVREAEGEGWRSRGKETDHVGPGGLVRVTTLKFEKPAPTFEALVVGEFYAVSVKAPVWLPRSTLRDFADQHIRDLAAGNGVTLTPVADPPADEAGAEVLEYRGRPGSGSAFQGDAVGVIARILPCDARGNVVIGAGFGATSVTVPTGPLTSTTLNVYEEHVKKLLAPAVGCP